MMFQKKQLIETEQYRLAHSCSDLMQLSVIGSELVPPSCSNGNAFVSGAGGLWFQSRAGQIRHNVANG